MQSNKHLLLLVVAVFSLLVVPLTAGAQHHTADWSYIGARWFSSAAIGKVDRFGKMTTVLLSANVPLYACQLCGTLDIDDNTYVMPLIPKNAVGSLILVDQGGTILKTIQVLNKTPQQGGGFTYDVTLDQDGNYIVTEGWSIGTQGDSLLKVDRHDNVSTIWQGSPVVNPRSVAVDIDSGNFLLAEFTHTGIPRVFSIAPDGSAITTVGTWPFCTSQISQHIGSGDLFTPGGSANVVYRMNAGGSVTTLLLPGLGQIGGVYPDRSSAANPRLVVGSAAFNWGLHFVDLKTSAITTLVAPAPYMEGINHVFPCREVATLEQGPGKWDIKLHFAGEAGNSYVIGLSVSGVRPGVPLPDGRRICLNADTITLLSVQGHLGSILQGNTGMLDPAGRATARLDVSALPMLRGVRVWILPVTFNPAAPLGIQTIADPVILIL